MPKYVIENFYSEEGAGYITVVPELPGCSAFGKTEEEALKEVKTTRKRNPQHPVLEDLVWILIHTPTLIDNLDLSSHRF